MRGPIYQHLFYSHTIGELNKIQCNYDFAHISPLVLNEAHIALQGEGFDSRTAQYMHPSILAIRVQTKCVFSVCFCPLFVRLHEKIQFCNSYPSKPQTAHRIHVGDKD